MMIAMVVCIDDVRHWLRGNALDSRSNMSADFVRTAGLDQNHSSVTDDDSGVDHVALIVLIRRLDQPKKGEHPIVDFDGPWFLKRLGARRDVTNQHSNHTEKCFHFDLFFGNPRTFPCGTIVAVREALG
jgi:hypothetical protein